MSARAVLTVQIEIKNGRPVQVPTITLMVQEHERHGIAINLTVAEARAFVADFTALLSQCPRTEEVGE